ncbi:dihydropyrimidinase [Providencia hangzhouensis]|uniref:Dihydropyrimidinase n=1 Tax=Providencia rettgeri TaxID=587 RepID=A0AAE2ZHE1_PRORE|nr:MULTISPECIES: dihydropyrimidinase [Providencia]MRF68624.1 dihydropyrimidinase [Escherichia coli]EHZ6872191.1 dihydropyrimidinase [Providencia rettgeri]MBG5892986.1 dihydropyrimidinase [Providencia rettgeri]MBG5928876.1 dihydropyrimidinase [Providencia rettgeri]MBI6190364.1 dihydropyrimidinase [Providencia rettgeri]
MFDTIIRNGHLVLEEGTVRADLAIKKGKIAALLGPDEPAECQKEIDAQGRLVLPGLIDAHMHTQAPFQGISPQLTFYQQSICAAFAGVTTYMDFTNTWKGSSVLQALDDRIEEMTESAIDFSVHGKFVEANEQLLDEIPLLAAKGCPTFKLFMTYRKEGVMADDMTLMQVFKRAKENNCMPLIHAESNAIAETAVDECIKNNTLTWRDFANSKPVICETEAFGRVAKLAESVGVPLLIVHTTNGPCLNIAQQAQERGQKLYIETGPHYLTLFDELYDDIENGHLAICSPPLRTRKERDELWDGIKNGTITLIGSDDCTFTREEKEKALQRDANGKIIPDFTKVVNGLSGLEIRFNLMVTEGVESGKITMNQAVALCSTNIAKTMGCYPQKGTLLPGADADIVIFDPNEEWVISANNLHSGAGYSLHEGYKAKGKVKTTLLRGEIIMDNNTFMGSKGQGKFIKRTLKLN